MVVKVSCSVSFNERGKHVKSFSKQERYFYLITILTLIGTTLLFKSSLLSMLVAILGFSGSLLNGKVIRYGLIMLAINTLLYGVISFSNQFYGEALLNIVYMCPLFVMGFIRWKNQSGESYPSKINSLIYKDWVGIIVLGIFVTIVYGFILKFFHSSYPFLNSLATYSCAVAGTLAARKIKQQWNFWFLYNIVLIFLWFTTMGNSLSQMPFFLLNIAFLGADYLGYQNWNKRYKAQINTEISE